MNVSFDDFKKLEIRVGKILTAEKIEGADRLLKLIVDFFDYKRQIVSGIAEFYKPEELVGKLSPFIVNLEPRVIRGVESQGMILAVSDGEKAVLLKPVKKVPAGSLVK